MSILTPIALLGLLLAIPILLLYMLRLRRREMLVSSNFLWQQVIRDREANTPWQRLRRNLLLILQLLILLLLVLALARPANVVPTISAGKTVVLLDASASMNALDGPNATSRFEQAQAEARKLVNAMGAGDEMSLIRVSDVTEPLTAYTNQRQTLLNAVNNAQAGQGGGDWETALTLAAAGAAGAEQFNIVLISDGGLGDTLTLPENIPQPIYIPVGSAADNLAITALATRVVPGEAPQLFARVDNYTDQTVSASLVISLDGEIWDATRSQNISARSQRSYVFGIDQPFSTIEATLVYGNTVTDYLALDDSAWTVATDNAQRRVLVVSAQDNVFIDQVLRSLPGVEAFRGNPERETLPGGNYDVYVFDGWLPQTLPDADMLIINPPRNTDLFTLGAETDAARGLEVVAPDDPLMTFLEFNSVNLRRFRPVTGSIDTWARPLVTVPTRTDDADDAGDTEAVLLAGEDAGRQIVLLPFALRDTDLALNITWPILMANMIEWFTPANVIESGANLSVGEVLTLRPNVEADSVRVTLPDASQLVLPVDAETLTFSQTHRPGLYRIDVLAEGDVLQAQAVAVNLFGSGANSNESDIAPVPANAIQLGGAASTDTDTDDEAADADEQFSLQEFWPLLALLALIMLLVEWVAYHRRQRIPTTVTPLERTTALNR